MNALRTTSPSSASRFSNALRAVALALALAAAAPVAAGEVRNPFEAPFAGTPASHANSEFAASFNPVFADVLMAPSLSYRLQYFDGQSGTDHLFHLNLAGFALTYGLFNALFDRENERVASARADYFSVGKGLMFMNVFGVGAAYAFSKSSAAAYDGYGGLSFSALFRPFDFLSFGVIARDVNAPELDGRRVVSSQVYSVSLRPWGEFVTLSLDAIHRGAERVDECNVVFAADVRAWREATVFASVDREGSFSFGARMPIDLTRESARTVVPEANRLQGRHGLRVSQAGLTLSGERYASPVTIFTRLLAITLNEPYPESAEERFLEKPRARFYDLLAAIRAAREDPTIGAITLSVNQAAYGVAQIQEIRAELLAFRQSGKRVYAALSEMSNRHYYLATAADEIAFVPASSFYLTGLKAEVYFFGAALGKAGVKYEGISRGRYKSLNEQFMRERMSPAHRSNLVSIIGELNRQFMDDIAASRRITRRDLDRFVARGVATPEEARQAGLINSIEYPAAALRRMAKRTVPSGVSVSLESYLAEARRMERWGPVPAVAVVYVEGAIRKGESRGRGLMTPDVIGDETYRKDLARAFGDPSVRAVVVRVNSGGGSALASDLMWRALTEQKEATKKPVVISFGNMAASGGYYIACTGDAIFVSAGTLTGSIGVVGGKVSLARLYRTLGINKDVVKMSEYADLLNEARDLSVRDRAQLDRLIGLIYRQFTDRVSAGRSIARADIPRVAEGRVFTGSQALGNKLADELGGLARAVDRAKRLAGIVGPCMVRHLPERHSSFKDLVAGPRIEAPVARELTPIVESLRALGWGSEPVLYLYPYIVVIE